MLRGIESRVGPVESDVVRERHVADAQVVIRAQRAERVLDAVTALESEEGADLTLPEVAPDVVGAEGQREPVGVLRNESARDVDLLQLHPRVPGVAILARRVNGPELRADHALLQAVEIGVARCTPAEIVGIDVSARD